MYYIYSFVITIILFGLIQIYEKNNKKEDEEYTLMSLNNVLIFVILFLVSSISLYYLFNNKTINLADFKFNLNFLKGGGNDANNIIKDEINPVILRQIPDNNINVGFEPFE